jgi:hypothetical protein
MGGGGGTSPPIRNPAVEGSGLSALRSGHSTPRKDPVPVAQVAEWAPGPVRTGTENLTPTRFYPRTHEP